MNLAERFRAAHLAAHERPALIPPHGPTLSYGALDDLAARFAAVLLERGLTPGERVVVQVDKSVGNVALYLAVLRLGGVYVPLNPAYTTPEVAAFIADAEPRSVVCRPEARAHVEPIAHQHGASLDVLGTDPHCGLWADALDAAPLATVAERAPHDLAAIVYTSGTTGRSKGAMLSHGSLLHNAETLHQLWGFSADDVLIHALPIFHVHGLFVALHTAWLEASAVRFLSRFDAEEVRRQLPHATVLMGVPTFYSRLAELPGFGAAECQSMRLFVSGSAPLTKPASDHWEALTGHRILERYGMSEAGMITSNPLRGPRVAGTVGFPLPGTEARVADDHGQPLVNGIGVLEIRGPSLFRGYWRMPRQTARAFRDDGFFVTGDNAHIDETGRVTLVGRSRDLVISGGLNIYPKQVEQVLDDIHGVAESAVIGAPHPDLGEGLVAVLVADAKPVDEAVIVEALSASLARFKHPRRVFWVDALPRNTMGKVQKAALREHYAGTYAAGVSD